MSLPRIMLVTDRHRTGGRDLVDCVSAAVSGGIELVQLREKDLPDDRYLDLLSKLEERVAGRAALLINGRPALAAEHGTGLHLPATATMGDSIASRPFGRSVHDRDEVLQALKDRPDYLVIGTVFPTGSKPGRMALGVGRLTELATLAGEVPVFGIGGIDHTNAGEVLMAGCHGVAVCSALLSRPDPAEAVNRLIRAVQ